MTIGRDTVQEVELTAATTASTTTAAAAAMGDELRREMRDALGTIHVRLATGRAPDVWWSGPQSTTTTTAAYARSEHRGPDADTQPSQVVEVAGWQWRGAQARPLMGPRAVSLCRICWERPRSTSFSNLLHVKYHYLCDTCRDRVTVGVSYFARMLHIHFGDMLDLIFAAARIEE